MTSATIRYLWFSWALILALDFTVLSQSPVEARPAPATASPGPSHILAANELIEIKVFQEPDLTTSARIPQDGRIVFPLIGEVSIIGKSVQEATRHIQDRLQSRFLVNPQVTITVVEHAQRLFTVIGQVQRPGTYRFPDRQALDLIQVIGIAGGYTRLADPGRITIKRRAQGGETVLRVDGKKLARDEKAQAFTVESGDLITVGERIF
jgi:protein involved in polysaccharide export with SLBB domain